MEDTEAVSLQILSIKIAGIKSETVKIYSSNQIGSKLQKEFNEKANPTELLKYTNLVPKKALNSSQ